MIRLLLNIAIILVTAYLLDLYFKEPPYWEYRGSGFSNRTAEQKSQFISFLRQEGIKYHTKYGTDIYYHLSGHAKVRAYRRQLYGSPDYDSVSPMDSQMETIYRKEFETAGIPYSVRMVGTSLTMNFIFEAKYNPQVDLIDQKAWLDWSERLKNTNEAIRGYPK